ncbi:Transcriptional adapter ada2 [Malassezia cuniculi]|uniref:Transcriptional adapter 2 n=1 Tax=Malassezia cuniculi TaxID=948313 RepID=A0AAF0EWI9_9BASI|nr:Transcriptional adapter ada2 [Malassezia cuniculi]
MTVSHRKPRPTQPHEDRSRGCEDFDLCGTCFCAGAQVGDHRAWHDYQVIEQQAYSIFCPDWGADEELLLIDGCQLYGLGNWADIADHIGNRTKEEVEEHYISVYIEGRNGLPSGDERAARAVTEWRDAHPRDPLYQGEERLPILGPDPSFKDDTPLDVFQRRRRARIEELRKKQAAFVPPKGVAAKPLVSQPTTHSELAGFMPGRLEFDQEYEQDAEHLIKDMEFGRVFDLERAPMEVDYDAATKPKDEAQDESMPASDGTATQAEEGSAEQTDDGGLPDYTEDPADLELKLTILDMYRERLDRRIRLKGFIFERNLVDYRRNTAIERRRHKEERELLGRIKHFATLQTAEDFETFYAGLCYEEALKRTIKQLQQYRRMGVSTVAEAAQYDKDAAERTKRQLAAAEGNLAFPSVAPHTGRGRARERAQSGVEDDWTTPDDRSEEPFSFATAPGIQLLSPEEQQLCSALHILPQPYLLLKSALLTFDCAHDRELALEHWQKLIHVGPKKLERVYDFFYAQGYVAAARSARALDTRATPSIYPAET